MKVSKAHTSLALTHSFKMFAIGANSPARLAVFASKDSPSRSASFVCSAASRRALVKRAGDKAESDAAVAISI